MYNNNKEENALKVENYIKDGNYIVIIIII
jgi:hypothetical protein